MLLFIDGFDAYTNTAAAIAGNWNSSNATPTFTATNARNGRCLVCTISGGLQRLHKTMASNIQNAVVGCGVRVTTVDASGGQSIFSFYDGSTQQCTLRINSNKTLSLCRGQNTAVTNGTSSLSLSTNQWYFIECKIQIADSIAASSCVVKVNGVDWITVATSQDMKAGSNAYFNEFRIGLDTNVTGDEVMFDDLYIIDTSGSVNNNFLGDCKVTTLLPSGAGNSTQWTPSTGSNYQCVDESLFNSDTDYVSSGTATHLDLYAMGDISGGTILGIKINAVTRKDDAGSRTVAAAVRTNSNNYFSSALSVTDGYTFLSNIWESNPNTSSAWTSSEINAMEAGLRLES